MQPVQLEGADSCITSSAAGAFFTKIQRFYNNCNHDNLILLRTTVKTTFETKIQKITQIICIKITKPYFLFQSHIHFPVRILSPFQFKNFLRIAI